MKKRIRVVERGAPSYRKCSALIHGKIKDVKEVTAFIARARKMKHGGLVLKQRTLTIL